MTFLNNLHNQIIKNNFYQQKIKVKSISRTHLYGSLKICYIYIHTRKEVNIVKTNIRLIKHGKKEEKLMNRTCT